MSPGLVLIFVIWAAKSMRPVATQSRFMTPSAFPPFLHHVHRPNFTLHCGPSIVSRMCFLASAPLRNGPCRITPAGKRFQSKTLGLLEPKEPSSAVIVRDGERRGPPADRAPLFAVFDFLLPAFCSIAHCS